VFLRASHGIPGDDRPWPASLDRDEDETQRISAIISAGVLWAVVPVVGLGPAPATRARRLAGRAGHLTALRHAFPAATYASLMGPWIAATSGAPAEPATAKAAPDVRRAR
jgi:hypothetical protein